MDEPKVPALDERLHAFFDAELGPGERDQMQAQIDADPDLGGQARSLAFMRELVVGTLEAEGEAVPQARFEQIWDQFETSVVREERMRQTTTQGESVTSRLSRWFGLVKVPLAIGAAAAAVVALTVIVPSVPGGGDGKSNSEAEMASKGAEPVSQPASNSGAKTPTSPKLAAAIPPDPNPTDMEDAFTNPTSNDAKIERLEFGGRSGTISQIQGTRGTTTVIWVQEDEQPLDTERSL